MVRRLALTTGEPAGIGPELSASVAVWFSALHAGAAPAGPAAEVDPSAWRDTELVLVGDSQLLAARGGAELSGLAGVAFEAVPLRVASVPGRLDAANGRYVLDTLDRAIGMVERGQAQAIVTAPVQKSVINDAGVPFSGHTEYLQERAGVDQVVMMLAGGGLRVALATTHLPLRAVPDAITGPLLDRTLRILDADLRARFLLAAPRIAVCGLNPHAGEGGYLGREEIDVIAPAIGRARAAGIDAHGPLPADTLFVPDHVAQYDAVLSMFHDQGLPVLKHASFGRGINVTLGLPYVRTSVDHGTALDLAGTGRADPGSLQQAVIEAIRMTPTA
ncbi:4-hydroxythreonine-4-phosphate dehydrogenase PdxA [Pigmentiphaga soli]|uniref:4-hydroxythreonine-4-phosphate dehydrogenase n=1 Tax=Pigmentiphaga soli TaxID=1007095 RepID=A0ABP8HL45_9BURK